MSFDSNVSLKFQNYKSFGDDKQGFDRIAPINVIIGRNNSGKSALLDIVDYATKSKEISKAGHKGKQPAVYFTCNLEHPTIESVFSKSTGGGSLPGNHYEFGKQLIGKPAEFQLMPDSSSTFISATANIPGEFSQHLARRIENPFKHYSFKRIFAERDIQPEGPGTPNLQSDGAGATNFIQYFLNESSANQKLVEVELLNALNNIFYPDAKFDRIQAKRLDDSRWEIFLEEKDKGSIPLSSSGSGLKTILLVLAQLILIPAHENKEVKDYIFAFEELENNLHPGLQRKLFSYLRDLATEKGTTFFITTHSNVVIDLFSSDPEAQLLHVIHNNELAKVRALTEYADHGGVLDDLDVRASDILQSNAVIWVEGPSDRVYINRYIELLSNGKLREGAHYQCVFYGGRLLARVSAAPQESDNINILKVNRHCCLVMDRDTEEINATKTRMKAEVESVGGYVWVTPRKEIESSIPLEALKKRYNNPNLEIPEELQPFDEYLEVLQQDEAKKFLRNKVLFAEEISPLVTLEMLNSDIELKEAITGLCEKISEWNKVEASPAAT